MIIIYTDGAAKGNPGPGGYGVILKYKDKRKEISQGYRLTTNNRMELMAVIVGLEAIRQPGWKIRIYSDSKYVVDAVTRGWLWTWQKTGFKKKMNVDLWKRFIPLYKKHEVEFKWVKGHAGHPENERCDQMAVAAAEGDQLLIDQGFSADKDL
jgi:ribonuclease HI